MAVIFAESSTNLSTPNSFYRMEAYNLGTFSSTSLALDTIKTIPITFANTGNCRGVVLCMHSQNYYNIDRSVTTNLEEAKTVGSFNTTTERINITGHGLLDGQPVRFTSTGTLPTGITSNTQYFVVNKTTDDFQIALTVGGAAINLGGTPSGTSTCWVERATKTLTANQILASTNKMTWGIYIDFNFTPYAVDTTAGKWRFTSIQNSGGSTIWYLRTSDATNPFYATWCDNAVSFSANDCVGVGSAARVTIDQDMALRGVLGTGDTTRSVCGFACRAADPTPTNVCGFFVPNPASPITITLDGLLCLGSHSGFQAGTSTTPISAGNLTITAVYANTNGTDGYSGFSDPIHNVTLGGNGAVRKMSLILYGAVPAVERTLLVGDVELGATSLVTDVSTGWVNGDEIKNGRRNTIGIGSTTVHTVTSVVGTTVNFTPALAGQKCYSGGEVMRFNGYGILFQSSTTTTIIQYLKNPSNFIVRGVQHKYVNYRHGTSGTTTQTATSSDDSAYSSKNVIEHCSCYYNGDDSLFSTVTPPELGIDIKNINSWKGIPFANNYYANKTVAYGGPSGNLVVEDFWGINLANANTMPVAPNVSFINNRFSNCGAWFTLNGISPTLTGNRFWGHFTSAIKLQTIVGCTWSGNYFDKCTAGILFDAFPTIGLEMNNDVFSSISSNTLDIDFTAGAYIDCVMNSPTGNLNIGTSNLINVIEGSMLRITDFNDTLHDDRTYDPCGETQRCGSGLADTKVFTVGGYPVRLKSTTSTCNREIIYDDIVTPDLTGKAITVGLKCEIANAAYWAGTHEMPRITVEYDDGSVVYGEAAQLTTRQYIHATFIPTTAAGKIKITLSTRTDATSTNAYVYFGDWSGGFLVNTDFATYSRALPTPPAYSFNVNAATFWDAAKSAMTASGSMGKFIREYLEAIYNFTA